MDRSETIQQNRKLVEEFPWLFNAGNVPEETLEKYDYYEDMPDECFETTALDKIEPGYKAAFGHQMCEEIERAREQFGCTDKPIFFVAGSLKHVIYDDLKYIALFEHFSPQFWSEYANVILPKYEKTAKHTCSVCGQHTDYTVRLGIRFYDHVARRPKYDFVRPMCAECIRTILEIEEITQISEIPNGVSTTPTTFDDCKLDVDNQALVTRFPFLKLGEDYEATKLDRLENGWKIAFGVPMCEKILQVLRNKGKDPANTFISWDRLRRANKYSGDATQQLLDSIFEHNDEDITQIIRYYEAKSRHICCECGQRAQFNVSVNEYFVRFFGLDKNETKFKRPFCAQCVKNLLSVMAI